MRRAAKTDGNQAEIVAALRKMGASVQPLHAVGGGVPDLLVAYFGNVTLLEVKDGSKPPSARKLTPDQVRWHEAWRSPVYVVTNVEEARQAVGIGIVQSDNWQSIGDLARDMVKGVVE